jgi:hypothetical protein
MPYLNLKAGDQVVVTVHATIGEVLVSAEGHQYLELHHGENGQLVSKVFADDDSVDVAFDEPKAVS